MKRILFWGVGILLLALTVLWRENRKLDKEYRRQTENVSALMGKVKSYKFRDSLNISEVSGLRLKVSELNEQREEDLNLIKELKLRPKDVQYITKTEVITKDSLIFILQPDSCFHHQSEFLKIDVCLRDSSLYYESRDSIIQVVYPEYRHKFLWFRWGLRGMKQKIINLNPHSYIGYSEFILLEH